VQEQHGRPGAEDPESIVLRQQRGMRRAVPVDTETAAVVGACDGTLSVGAIVAAVATLLDEDEPDVRGRVVPPVRTLVAYGVLDAPPG
jgi:archaeosine-15-forming tRNA-guanine transglycosylase